VTKRPSAKTMIRILIPGAAFAMASAAPAQTLITDVTYQYLGNNFAGTTIPADPSAAYSSLAGLGAGRAPGSSGGSPPRTFAKADDFAVSASSVGQRVQAVRFVMWNAGGSFGATQTQGRLQLGFWLSDGAGSLPGSYLFESSRLIGYTTPLHTFDLGATVMTLNLGEAGFTLGSGRLWAAIAWEGIDNPPANQGSAASLGYVVGSAPSAGQSNPGGVGFFVDGVPFGQPAPGPNFDSQIGPFAMEFIVPSPSGMSVLATGGVLLIRRRRC